MDTIYLHTANFQDCEFILLDFQFVPDAQKCRVIFVINIHILLRKSQPYFSPAQGKGHIILVHPPTFTCIYHTHGSAAHLVYLVQFMT